MPTTADRKLRVFLCHSSQDKPIVRELYQQLNTEGWIDPWLDEEKLLPGQDWDMEIEKAVEASDAVIVCISNNSITKEGYVQRELRKVLDVADEKPEGAIFIIPIRLDDCIVPRRIKNWQYVDYYPKEQREKSYSRLRESLKFRANVLRVVPVKPAQSASNRLRESSDVHWNPVGIAPVHFPSPVRVFISYSHKDESFKDELVTMLTGLQRRGLIDAWQDRRIESGSDWFAAIKKAMEECEVAILLVSPDFMASRFIQEVELNHFFQQRINKGLWVVPIIIRSCLWQNETVIKDLQVLPKDGQPVIRFSKENGDRDQVWTDICKSIESILKSI